MKASVGHDDLVGTVAVDISDFLGGPNTDNLNAIAKYFKLDKDRFKIVGLSITGTENFKFSLICVDKNRSTNDREHIVSMSCDIVKEDQKDILDILFKRLHIVLHNKYEEKYTKLGYHEEVSYSDYHDTTD